MVFAFYLARQVLAYDTGTPEMRKVWNAIFTGAQAYLRRQYLTIAFWRWLPVSSSPSWLG